jgi:hypothetical protein
MQMFGNMQNMQSRFQQFVQNFQRQNGGNANPQQMVQNLLNSGRMSQEQFNQIQNVANMVFGKNGNKPF